MNSSITAVIITQDEERNIGRCLQSLCGVVDGVVVVDSGSTDATEEICRGFGERGELAVRFVHHDWVGYSAQKNYANGLVDDGWILSIDADEALSDGLRASLLKLKSEPAMDGEAYRFPRLNNYCGHWLRHGGWYPDEAVRLWRAGAAEWEGLVHETLRWRAPVVTRKLEGDLLHYTYYGVDEHARRTAKYAPMAAEKAYENGKRCGWGSIVFRPAWTFLSSYVLKLGFLDGGAGFVASRISAHYTLLKYARLRELSSR